MKNIALLLLLVGFLITIFTAFNLFATQKVVDLGPIEVVQRHNYSNGWSPAVGIVMIVIGGAVFLSTKKTFSLNTSKS
jgi:hypothetical protein